MISVENLVFEYPTKRALHGITFTIEPKTITAMVGPNGAGKTTLIRCMVALAAPFAGNVTIDGCDSVEQPRDCHRKIGYLADLFGLYDTLSVRHCLTYAARTHGITMEQVEPRVLAVAQSLQLDDRLEMKAGELSRGLRQRLAIGQAIIHRPSILVLDEPASGLDPKARNSLAELLVQLRDQEDMTIIVSSHILAELEAYSSHLMMIDDGRMTEFRAIQELKDESKEYRVELADMQELFKGMLSETESVSNMIFDGNFATFGFQGDKMELHMLLKDWINKGLPVCGFGEVQQNLQDVYLKRVKD